MTHIPTTERYWHSETLNRRVTLAEVFALSDADLAMFRLEMQDAATSIREQIERHGDAANPEWKKRAIGKQRHAGLFVVAAGEEKYRRDYAQRMEHSRLKAMRITLTMGERSSQTAAYGRTFYTLVAEALGKERAKALSRRAAQIIEDQMGQAP